MQYENCLIGNKYTRHGKGKKLVARKLYFDKKENLQEKLKVLEVDLIVGSPYPCWCHPPTALEIKCPLS